MHSIKKLYQSKTFKKFLSNKPALLGAVWICCMTVLAIFGNWIAWDNSPNANHQDTNIQLQAPLFSTKVVKINKGLSTPPSNVIQTLVRGKPWKYRYQAIEAYRLGRDSIFLSIKDYQTSIVTQSAYDFFALTGNENADSNYVKRHHISNKTYLLGTDNYGRSVLSRIIIGTRISLLVGLIAVIISLTLGLVLGATAGYFGGWIDQVVLFLINTVWSIPTLLLVFAIVLAFGKSVSVIFVAVGLTMWVEVARVVRSQALTLRELPYVEAAQAFGASHFRILARHILPNTLGPVMVVAASNFAVAILLEAGLSYLGFGVQPPAPSWGNMLNEYYAFALSGRLVLAFVPAVAIMLLVLAFNLVGNGLRDAFDVR